MPEPNEQVLTVVCLAFRSSEPWQSTLLPLTLFMPQSGKYLRALTVAMSGQSLALNGHRIGVVSKPTVWSLAIDPLTPTTLYAGTTSGVFKISQDSPDESTR